MLCLSSCLVYTLLSIMYVNLFLLVALGFQAYCWLEQSLPSIHCYYLDHYSLHCTKEMYWSVVHYFLRLEVVFIAKIHLQRSSAKSNNRDAALLSGYEI